MNRRRFICASIQYSLLAWGLPVRSEEFINVCQDFDPEVLSGLATNFLKSIGGYITSKPAPACRCVGDRCAIQSTGIYSTKNRFYGISNDLRQIVLQTVSQTENKTSNKIHISNKSMAFFDEDENWIANIEGPSLYAICKAQAYWAKLSAQQLRDRLLPITLESDAGYRFDKNPCNPMVYQTRQGRVQVRYKPLTEYAGTAWINVIYGSDELKKEIPIQYASSR